MNDELLMNEALVEARIAADEAEIPIGAVVALDGAIIGRGRNVTIRASDPTGHAEIQAIREAAAAIGNHRLVGATLYTTLEPCAMCAGAIIEARIARVVVAARDAKSGAAGSVLEVIPNARLNHRPVVEFGLKAEESAALLVTFFKERR
jgi:tRNA(adenine34) deaminase